MLTVFISDLHLHPDNADIDNKFSLFCQWAIGRVDNLYVLGDFFHVWVGDDSLTEWSRGIARRLKKLSSTMKIFFIPGNRDFLIGATFAKLAGFSIVSEPYLVNLGLNKVLLAHGDRFCTLDVAHQRFRKIMASKFLCSLFLKLPLSFRVSLSKKIRKMSASKKYNSVTMNVVAQEISNCQKKFAASVLIHGHTHSAGLTLYPYLQEPFHHYILSDWDDSPKFLCYDLAEGFYFKHLP